MLMMAVGILCTMQSSNVYMFLAVVTTVSDHEGRQKAPAIVSLIFVQMLLAHYGM